jgi:superoxide reductase
MMDIFQTADWKQEKHVPVIELPEKAEKGKDIKVAVTVGKEIPHPNKTEHHIAWIDVFFLPEGEKFPYHLGRFGFSSHGASVNGPDTSTVYTSPTATLSFRTEKGGKLMAFSYCNIHGLWTSSEELKLG